MGKIMKAFRALWWIARKPVLLNRVLTEEDQWQKRVESRYGMGQGLPVITMDLLFGDREATLGPLTFLDGGSLPTDLMLLAGLAGTFPGCSYFEIGTWRGESAAVMSPRVGSCHTLSLSEGEMRGMGMHERNIASHRIFSKGLENVVHLQGDSRKFDFEGLDRTFDLVFIDGDHHHDAVVSDTSNVFRHLVHEKSIVVWHDYGFHPDRVRFEVMAGILEGAGRQRTGQIYHVAHTKCAIYTGRTYESTPPDFPVIPREYYETRIIRKNL